MCFKFRTCNLDIVEGDESRRHFRPCILHSIKQCTAPCAARVSLEDYRDQVRRLRQFLESKGAILQRELTAKMKESADAQQYERAAELRDELAALGSLQLRGLAEDEQLQPEVFFIDPTQGLGELADVLGLDKPPRTIEGIDIAHLDGGQMCGSLVTFIDGKPVQERLQAVQDQDRRRQRRLRVHPRGRLAAIQAGRHAGRALPRHHPDRRRQGPAIGCIFGVQ